MRAYYLLRLPLDSVDNTTGTDSYVIGTSSRLVDGRGRACRRSSRRLRNPGPSRSAAPRPIMRRLPNRAEFSPPATRPAICRARLNDCKSGCAPYPLRMEWRTGRTSPGSRRFPLPETSSSTCPQTCHMVRQAVRRSTEPRRPGRRIRFHRWLGGNTLRPQQYLQESISSRPSRAFLKRLRQQGVPRCRHLQPRKEGRRQLPRRYSSRRAAQVDMFSLRAGEDPCCRCCH